MARAFIELDADERQALVASVADFAADGRVEYYKS
jgi:hypothetical protein